MCVCCALPCTVSHNCDLIRRSLFLFSLHCCLVASKPLLFAFPRVCSCYACICVARSTRRVRFARQNSRLSFTAHAEIAPRCFPLRLFPLLLLLCAALMRHSFLHLLSINRMLPRLCPLHRRYLSLTLTHTHILCLLYLLSRRLHYHARVHTRRAARENPRKWKLALDSEREAN